MNAPLSQQIRSLLRQTASLLLFQQVLANPVGQAYLHLLQTLSHTSVDGLDSLQAYGHWFQAMTAQQQSWQDYLLTQILRAENPFTQAAQQKELTQISPGLVTAAQHDLQILQSLYACGGKSLSQWLGTIAACEPVVWDEDTSGDRSPLSQLPVWAKFESLEHWADGLPALADYYRQAGVGLFGAFRAFRWQSGKLEGIAHPDPIQLNALVGYEMQRATLIQNTEALLAGYPALHVLLYGSRGSGKSSLVKGLLNQYGDRQLRLIEVSKADLKDLPLIVDPLRQVPQKFIIFVDDLSFEEDDDAFKALKVVLEGSVTARPQNVVVYATSNRRHLIREFFGDRPRPRDADEIHAWDTLQEKLSFSDRFGLTLTFEPADQDTYLDIVRHLAAQASLTLPPEDLQARALQWATRHNGRSGRTARQFVDFLRAELAVQSLS